MMTTTTNVTVTELDLRTARKSTLERLRELSFGNDGEMCGDIEHPFVRVFVARNQSGHILGWLTSVPVNSNGRYINFNVFVDTKHRGRGVAKTLVRTAKQTLRTKHRKFQVPDLAYYARVRVHAPSLTM